ncbi:MAG: rRNA pseudouridine synthase [Candidatus Gracilibacteria bacterium]|nr:rRNA pseudouridine synthase [Candidatus Gracilibacteria bacterium]
MEEMRLQKYLSQAGICSRRKAEEYISKGLVKVNGKIAEVGQKINSKVDKVELLDEAVKIQENFVYYKLNKPRGIVTTCAQYKENAIIDIVDIKERVFPIGRLDKDTTGLILLTNDGRLANFLMHPKYNHEKEYLVSTFGPISDKAIDKLKKPMFILGSYTAGAKVKRASSGKVKITITEGKNRQIRRMIERVGYDVKTLKRIRIENIELGSLEPGEYVHLSNKEKKNLFEKLGIKA